MIRRRGSAGSWWCSIGLALGVLASIVSCSSPPPTSGASEGFRRISVLDEDDANGRLAYYLVKGGELSFAGGMAAFTKTPESTQPLDPQAMKRIVKAIEDAGWLAPTPPESIGDGPRSLSVEIAWSGGRRAFRVQADGRRLPERSEAVVVLLKEIADRRFKELIDSLPRGR